MSEPFTIDRRKFLRLMALGAAAGLTGCSARSPAPLVVPPGQTLARFPEKDELILLTDRPPQLETPLYYFREDLTPNSAFFVRWHYGGIPTSIDSRTFRLHVGGDVQKQLELSLDQLRERFEPTTLVAVAQCSGNSRSYFEPRIPGGQWGHGAVGNARWTGVKVKDLLKAAGTKSNAFAVSFAGLDEPPLSNMPKFVKSLPIETVLKEEILVAYEMNGQPLPMLNGYPLRLVVPGWYATYWVKALNEITVLPQKFEGFWMDKAYRIPNNPTANESPEHLATNTIPINRMSLRSIFVRPDVADVVKAGTDFEIEGLAFDAGHGIKQVEVSTDGGRTWGKAKLQANDLGKYSWQRWKFPWRPSSRGTYRLLARAANNAGEIQGVQQWNKSGYMRGVIESVEVSVV